MFSQRTSSAKPGDDLLATFRQQFPEVSATGSPTNVNSTIPPSSTANASATVPSQERRVFNPHRPDCTEMVILTPPRGHNSLAQAGVFSDQDPTPRANGNEPWRFTPSLLDPGSFSFSSFQNNNNPVFYAQAPGNHNGTLYQAQTGDLHAPTMPINMPLSLGADGVLQNAPTGAVMDMSANGFHGGLHPQAFHGFQQFGNPAPSQTSFAQPSFVPHEGAFEMPINPTGGPHDGTTAAMAAAASAFQNPSGLVTFPPGQTLQQQQQQQQQQPPFNSASAVASMAMLATLPASAEKFRFHTTLNAPTAMVKHADEIPISYLNKGQAYSLSIIDTASTLPIAPGTRYRTFVRISFEDEQQRQKPSVCWSLWKEGRGTNEAHQRGGKLQAVEYVETGQPAEGDEKRTHVELERSSFDGFSVIWTPGIHGAAECNIAVRFNFLSTDFSHSKGVKGIPVRLCAKTTRYPMPAQSPKDGDSTPEICYCKVKLFRDHGAERKLSNDVAHVKKTIEKLKQQIAQEESGMKDFSKRKRSAGLGIHGGQSKQQAPDLQRGGKAIKHKRTWSVSSASSNGNGHNGVGSGIEDNGGVGLSSSVPVSRSSTASGVRLAVEEGLHAKLQTLQDMFTSTRPASILYLRGDELDDPDLHPVSLQGEPGSGLTKTESRDSLAAWRLQSGRSSMTGSSIVSPSPSSLSLHSQLSMSGGAGIGAASGLGNSAWPDYLDPQQQGSLKSDQPTRINRGESGGLNRWIDALDVDAGYRPPQIERPKPQACFYVLRRSGPSNAGGRNDNGDDRNGGNSYYRAVYLLKRTLQDFVGGLAAKWGLDRRRVVRTLRVLPQGLEVEMDDDSVMELPEGQDMVLDIAEVALPAHQRQQQPRQKPVKTEWEMAIDGDGGGDGDDDGDDGEDDNNNSAAYEFRLFF